MKLNINGRKFEIRFMDDDWKDDANLHGQIIYGKRDIKIAESTDINTAIIHEALHWLSYSNGWELPEERVISFAIHISDLIRNNPQFDFRKEIKPEVNDE